MKYTTTLALFLSVCTLQQNTILAQEIIETQEAPSSINWAAKKAEWEAMTDEEKAAKKSERKAEWEAMTDEEKAAIKAEKGGKRGKGRKGGRK